MEGSWRVNIKGEKATSTGDICKGDEGIKQGELYVCLSAGHNKKFMLLDEWDSEIEIW